MTNVNSPNLGSVFSKPTIRKTIYGIYVVAAILVGGAAVYFASIGAQVPEIVVGAQAVIAYLAIPVGGLAVANTSTKQVSE